MVADGKKTEGSAAPGAAAAAGDNKDAAAAAPAPAPAGKKDNKKKKEEELVSDLSPPLYPLIKLCFVRACVRA